MIIIKQKPGVNVDTFSHMVFYIPRNTGQSDSVSNLVIDFKDNRKSYVLAWVDSIVKEINQLPKIDFVARILSSKETSPSGKEPLDILGKAIAKATNSKYCPKCLTKKQIHRPLKTLTRDQRINELNNLYKFSLLNCLSAKNEYAKPISLLIIDDVYTTGTSMDLVCREIRKKYTKDEIIIHLFVIGRTTSAKHSLEVPIKYNQEFFSANQFPSILDESFMK